MREFLDIELAKRKEQFGHHEFILGSSIVVIAPDDERIRLRTDCSFCVATYDYAKKHNKDVLYNLYTEDLIGVVIDDAPDLKD